MSITTFKPLTRLSLLTLCIFTTACNATDATNKSENVKSNSPQPEQQTMSSSEHQKAEALAINTLQEHLGQTKSQIQTVSVEAVDWPDASIGCPKEGYFYPQVITPGYKVILQSGGQTYAVHTAQQRAIICEKPGKQKAEVPTKKIGKLNIETLTERAKIHLANTLGVELNEIELEKINAVTWHDASLGCPQPKTDYAKMQIRGYVIHLKARGKNYTYHTDNDSRVFACPDIATS